MGRRRYVHNNAFSFAAQTTRIESVDGQYTIHCAACRALLDETSDFHCSLRHVDIAILFCCRCRSVRLVSLSVSPSPSSAVKGLIQPEADRGQRGLLPSPPLPLPTASSSCCSPRPQLAACRWTCLFARRLASLRSAASRSIRRWFRRLTSLQQKPQTEPVTSSPLMSMSTA